MSEQKTSPFWNFSLRLYRAEGVAGACIRLQDMHGIDVNVMLYGLWLASQGRALSRTDMHAIVDATESWRLQVVVPLRAVRRILKTPAHAAGKGAVDLDNAAALLLREKVKVAELEAERLQQEALFALKPAAEWGAAEESTKAAAHNLDQYARALRADFDASACKAMLAGFAQITSTAAA